VSFHLREPSLQTREVSKGDGRIDDELRGPSLIGYISISILVLYPLYMINVYGTNPTSQKTV